MAAKSKHGFISHFTGSSAHKRKFTDEEIEVFRKRRLDGETYQSIADSFSIKNRNSIRQAIQRHNPIVDNTTIPKDYIELIDYSYEHNIPRNTVYRWVKKDHLKSVKINNKYYVNRFQIYTPTTTIPNDKFTAIYILKENGFSQREIATALDLAESTISKYLKEKETMNEEIKTIYTNKEFWEDIDNGTLDLYSRDMVLRDGVKYKIDAKTEAGKVILKRIDENNN